MTLPLRYRYQNSSSRLQMDAKLFVKILFAFIFGFKRYVHGKSYLFFFIFRYKCYVHGKSVPELPLISSAFYHILPCFYTFQLQKSLNHDDFKLED